LERGWSPREAERNVALVEAIGRVSTFLETNVRKPLMEAGQAAEADELRERIEYALGALSDIDFFLEKPSMSRSGQSLVSLVEHVAHEFSGDQDIRLRLQLDSSPVRAVISGPVIMDVLYLILHNAARFGGGATVDLTVETRDGRALVTVRDRGEGFSEEAFKRAFDPFYSTSKDGLGLGLPHGQSRSGETPFPSSDERSLHGDNLRVENADHVQDMGVKLIKALLQGHLGRQRDYPVIFRLRLGVR
jgi:signal transduction histidine kinase